MSNAIDAFVQFCVSGITADTARCRTFAETSMGIVTVLNPHIGYAAAAEVVKEHLASGKPIVRIVLDKRLLTEDELKRIFELQKMTEPGVKQ